MDYYYNKIVYNYNDFEVFTYRFPILKHKLSKINKKKPLFPKPKIKKTDYRSRTNIRRILSCNINQDTKFLTLTFAQNITSLTDANYQFKLFIKRLKYHYNDFFYLSVPEFQKRGAVHYHIIINLPYLPKKIVDDLWSLGFTFIEKVSDPTSIPLYLSKYVTKSIQDPRYYKKKKYFVSRNALRPIIDYNIQPHDIFDLTQFNKSIDKNIQMKFRNQLNYQHYKKIDC